MNMAKLLSLLILSLLLSCSDEGYVEVRNQSGATITNVKVGEKIILGSIGNGSESGRETEDHGSYHVTFIQGGTTYESKASFNVDVRTSATFIYRDSNDVIVKEPKGTSPDEN